MLQCFHMINLIHSILAFFEIIDVTKHKLDHLQEIRLFLWRVVSCDNFVEVTKVTRSSKSNPNHFWVIKQPTHCPILTETLYIYPFLLHSLKVNPCLYQNYLSFRIYFITPLNLFTKAYSRLN